ncbi:immunity 22 family protein [Jeotgalibacillus sp. ET6]|uniref:immunity 22 family protein n=1 Tax=Jeotgalibacillus sp. ET6 TaxID=3037260 RepID=UPI0024186D53|nr:immunity 22 family protein [Jeotgalibacillus sp. ET6]MDG5471416.1 immunity 22 family protein [Jeotgalibacillus sp. ET6]
MKQVVSLWLGNFQNFDELEKYTEVQYNEDGDSIPSPFEKEFKLGYFDRDLIEKDCIPDAEDDIEKLLIDFSYDDQLIKQFTDVELSSKYNTIIVIYNYNFTNDGRTINSVNNLEYELNFIGTAEYVD